MQKDDKKSSGDKVDCLVQALADSMYDSKENIDQALIDSWRQGTVDSTKLFSKIISSCLQEQESRGILNDLFMEGNPQLNNSSTIED